VAAGDASAGSGSSASEAGTDHEVLRSKAYATPDKFADRAAIYAYRQHQRDFLGWSVQQVDWPAGGVVLDLGCGPGYHLARLGQLRPDLVLIGADLSDGMLRTARTNETRIRPVVADASLLPFVSGSLAGVMANHMLYHVADQDAALAEVRRVLPPGGSFVASTNAEDHFAEFQVLVLEATGRRRQRISERFTIDTGGEVLAAHFDEVELHELHDELVVPDPGAVMRYARSARDLSGSGATDEQWERAMLALERVVTDRIERDGPLHLTVHTGAFVCR
jgi:SAM-dependent methyltransferase